MERRLDWPGTERSLRCITKESTFKGRPWSSGAAVAGFVMLAIYVVLIANQGDGSFLEVLPWAMLMGVAASAALVGAQIQNLRAARIAMVAAALLFALLGTVSILSIGIGFLLAAALAIVAATRLSKQ